MRLHAGRRGFILSKHPLMLIGSNPAKVSNGYAQYPESVSCYSLSMVVILTVDTGSVLGQCQHSR